MTPDDLAAIDGSSQPAPTPRTIHEVCCIECYLDHPERCRKRPQDDHSEVRMTLGHIDMAVVDEWLRRAL